MTTLGLHDGERKRDSHESCVVARVGGAFRFQTDDSRYKWLNAILALWEGDFNSGTGRARYKLYVPVDAG